MSSTISAAEPVSLERISNALKSIDTKKDNLRRAFEYVQLHSSTLSSPTLQWSDLEDHFNSIQKSLEERFKDLESKEKKSQELETTGGGDKQSVKVEVPLVLSDNKSNDLLEPILIHPELKSLCVKMDGIGLQLYITNHRNDLESIRKEIVVAFRCSLDPSKLVLDAMLGFYPLNSKQDKKGTELLSLRKTCLFLLEELMMISSQQIKPKVKKQAKKLAVEWKAKITHGDENHIESTAFFQLLITYGLASEFSLDEILDIFTSIAWRKRAVKLFRALLGSDKVSDFIQKLSGKGKQLDAIKFAYAFELVDKFPPVPLLEAYLKETMKVALEIRKKGNHTIRAQNEAADKEITSLKAMIKCIEENQLESQFPINNLEKRIEKFVKQKADKKQPATVPDPKPQLRLVKQKAGWKRLATVPDPKPQLQLVKQKADRKRTATVPDHKPQQQQQQQQQQPGTPKPQQQQQQQSGNKRSRTAAHNTGAVMTITTVNSQVYPKSMGMVPGQMAPYLGSLAQYGWPATTPPSQYPNAAAGPSGFGATPMNAGMHLNPSMPNFYPSDPHSTPDLYRAMAYGGYRLPPSYGRSPFY